MRALLLKNGLQNVLCGFFLCATEKKGIKKIDGEKELIRSLRVPMHVWFAMLHRRTSKNFGNSFCNKSSLMTLFIRLDKGQESAFKSTASFWHFAKFAKVV